MRRVPGMMVATGSLETVRTTKTFASSEGSDLEQEITETGCGIEATAVDPETGEVQNRSYPNSGDQWGGRGLRAGRRASICPATPSASPAKPWPC